MAQRLSTDDFYKKLNEKNAYFRDGKFQVIGEYIGMHYPIDCECPIHGKWTVNETSDLMKGGGCPSCAKESRRISNTKTTERFLKELYEKNTHFRNGEFTVIGEYVSGQTPVECRCPIHGVWKTSNPDHLLGRNGSCPKCAKDRTRKKLSRSKEEFLAELNEKNFHYHNGEFKVIGDYVNSNTPIDCECPVHGIWTTSRPSDLLHGGGCPKCSGIGNLSNAEFLERLKEKNIHYQNGEFKVIGEYINGQTPIECECPIHGVWTTSLPANLLNGNLGCPKCNNTSTSFAENYIRCALQLALPDAAIPDKGDRKLLEGLEIDIPVYKYGFAVEFGAWHWHKEKYKDDIAKHELLREKGITLLTLPGLGDTIFVYSNNLAQEKNWGTLKQIVSSILTRFGFSDDGIDWKVVGRNAVILSTVQTTKEFLKALYENNAHYRNGEFEVIGDYVNSQMPIKCRCPVHGVWNTSKPTALLYKNGSCPKCRGLNRTTEDFLNDLTIKNAHYKNGEFFILGEYVSATDPIECECPVQGRWKTTPQTLLKGVGCKRCSYLKNGSAKKPSKEEFLKELFEKNEAFREGRFTVVGEYIRSNDPIACECPIHGVWNTTNPYWLLRGRGCPKCAGRGKITTDDFIEKLRGKNTHFQKGEFRVVGEYVNAVTPIECECPVHGIWKTSRPNDLLASNTGCPKCGRSRNGK